MGTPLLVLVFYLVAVPLIAQAGPPPNADLPRTIQARLTSLTVEQAARSYSLRYTNEINVEYTGPITRLKNNRRRRLEIRLYVDGDRYDRSWRDFDLSNDGPTLDGEHRVVCLRDVWAIYTPSHDPGVPGLVDYDDKPPFRHPVVYIPLYNLDLSGAEIPFYEILVAPHSELLKVDLDSKVDNHPATFLEMNTSFGHYQLWLDPACEYLPRKAIIAHGPKDWVERGKPLSMPYTPQQIQQIKDVGVELPPIVDRQTITLDHVVIERRGGLPFLISGILKIEMDYRDGSKRNAISQIQITDLELAPTFDETKVFTLSFIPNGTKARSVNEDTPGRPYVWHDGQLIPRENLGAIGQRKLF